MKVIITGSTGFVGTNLMRYLSENRIPFSSISREDLPFVKASQMEKGDCVVHLAGKAHDLRTSPNPEEYYKTNFELTKVLYSEFLKSRASKFVLISSVKAVADHLTGPLTEDHLPNPQTHYGKSKFMAEEFIKGQPLPEGKSWFILRPCMIHGPGNKGNMNLLYKFVNYRIPYILGEFSNERSFLSVENLCFLIREIVNRTDIRSGVYNVADDETLSTLDVVNLIASVTGKRAMLWNISPFLIKKLARLGDTLRLPLTTERLNKLVENYVVDNSKIKRELKRDFPVDARSGLIKTLESFQRRSL